MQRVKNKWTMKDETGAGSIEFIISFVLMMFIFFTMSSAVVIPFKQQTLEQAKMKGLDAMQANGGLTAEIESALVNYLSEHNLDPSNIVIFGTPAEVQWGDDIGITIRYTETVKRYRRTGLLGFESYDEQLVYEVSGSTISYHFNNN